MGLNAKKPNNSGNKQFAPQKNITPGTYPARLVQLIDLGVQPQRAYMGKDKPPVQEIMLTYELVDEFMKDEDGKDLVEKPRWLSETLPFFGLHADKAKSTQRYLAFDPNEDYEGDFTRAVGAPINLTVVNNPGKEGKVYDNVATLSPMRPKDAANCPELVNPTKVFDLEAPDMEVFNALPEWIQEKIKGNLNYQGSPLQKQLGNSPKEQPKTDKQKEAPKGQQNVDDDDDNPY